MRINSRWTWTSNGIPIPICSDFFPAEFRFGNSDPEFRRNSAGICGNGIQNFKFGIPAEFRRRNPKNMQKMAIGNGIGSEFRFRTLVIRTNYCSGIRITWTNIRIFRESSCNGGGKLCARVRVACFFAADFEHDETACRLLQDLRNIFVFSFFFRL